MAEITPHIPNKNPWASTAVCKGSENRLKDKHINSFQKKWPNIEKRKFKRQTDRMSFLITYTVWSALFLEKENKKNEYIVKLEKGKEERRAK